MSGTRLGDGLLSVAVLIWLSIAVGPWWVGPLLFLVAGVINYAEEQWL